jgi:hypothetical protein
VVAAPCERELARRAVGALTGVLNALRGSPVPVLLDLGEVDPKEPGVAELLGGLAALLVVARAVPEQTARLRSAAQDLTRTGRWVKVVLIGEADVGVAARLVGLPIAGVLPLINPDAGPVVRAFRYGVHKAFGAAAIGIAAELAALVAAHTPASALVEATR